MVRILVINPNSSAQMTSSIRRSATAVLRPGPLAGGEPGRTELAVVRTPGAPRAIDTREDEDRAVAAMLRLPDLDGPADALVIACFGDPGVPEVAARTGLPVIGMAWAAMTHASQTHGSFGILVASQDAVAIMTDMVERYGMGEACAGIEAIGVGVAELDRDLSSHRAGILSAARRLVDAGAASICLGCSALGSVAESLAAELGVPVLDAVPIAVLAAEAEASARRIAGR